MGTEATLVRHCNSVCYAHRVVGAKQADAAFFVAAAVNGHADGVSFMSTNMNGAYLGLKKTAKGVRLGLVGGKISPDDKDAGSFLKVPPLSGGLGGSGNGSTFSLKSLATSFGPDPLYVTQYAGDPCTVGCGGCVAPHGSKPDPTHKCKSSLLVDFPSGSKRAADASQMGSARAITSVACHARRSPTRTWRSGRSWSSRRPSRRRTTPPPA